MSITEKFQIGLYLPAPAAERRAHGLTELTCALVLSDLDESDPLRLANVADRLLPNEEGTAICVLGDFGEEITKTMGGMRSGDAKLNGLKLYWAPPAAVALSNVFSANVEMVALFRASEERLHQLSNREKSKASKWWEFSERSPIGALISMADGIPVAIYSPSDNSLELFGEERAILDAFHRFEACTLDPN